MNKINNLNDTIQDLSAQVIIIRNGLKKTPGPPMQTGQDETQLPPPPSVIPLQIDKEQKISIAGKKNKKTQIKKEK